MTTAGRAAAHSPLWFCELVVTSPPPVVVRLAPEGGAPSSTTTAAAPAADAGAWHKACASVGWNPTFDDVKEKIVEPYLLDYDGPDFYGATLEARARGAQRAVGGFGRAARVWRMIDCRAEGGDFAAARKDKLPPPGPFLDPWCGSAEPSPPIANANATVSLTPCTMSRE